MLNIVMYEAYPTQGENHVTDQIDAKAAEKMGKAKARLVIDHPFFASIVCSMPVTEDNTYPTMATNGKWIKYNAKFVNDMTMAECLFVLCHEVMHCVFAHMFRRGTRDPWKWNVAGDYVINDILVNEKVGEMPKQGLLDHALVHRANGTTEGVFDLLPDDKSSGGGGRGCYDGQGGNPLDEVIEDGGSEAERSEAEADMRVRLAQAAQAAKMCGKMSANIERFVDQALKPKVDWRDVLRRFISIRAKVDYTFAKPKRRFLAEDLYLPSLGGESMGEILIAVDCSGSIGAEELAEFAAEITAIKEDVKPSVVHVAYFDSRVCHYDKFEQDDELHIEPHGGGGTAFSPVFRYAEEHDIDPVCCVFLTDLYCADFGDPTPYPVLWVSTAADQAPWGEVIMMKQVAR
jgi:predicted metal-dependent peptidase